MKSGGCGTPFMAEISGRSCWSRPESFSNSKPRRAAPSVRSLVNSSRRAREKRREFPERVPEWRRRWRARWRSRNARKANRAKHAQFILGEAAFGIADGADEPSVKILLAADVVEDLPGIVAHQQAVDGEIAAGDVFLRCFGVNHAIGMPAIGIAHIGAKVATSTLAVSRRTRTTPNWAPTPTLSGKGARRTPE